MQPQPETLSDTQEIIGGSRLQHGPASNRIYLMKLDPADLPGLPAALDRLAARRGYTKIFAKIPAPAAGTFAEHGYQREGTIPRFFHGRTDAAFMGKFIDPARAETSQRAAIDAILGQAHAKAAQPARPLPEAYRLRQATEADADALAGLYRAVFASYPFPIHDPAYLLQTMRSHIVYFVAERNGVMAAAASGEMDRENENAEMTDFATRPEDLGNGLASHLLGFMEPEMHRRGLRTLYTIARAISPGINITFARRGYRFGGTLLNNTQISGAIESMNLWYRHMLRDTDSATETTKGMDPR